MGKVINNPVISLKLLIGFLMFLLVAIGLEGCYDFNPGGCFAGSSTTLIAVGIIAGLMSFYYLSKIKRTSNITSGV